MSETISVQQEISLEKVAGLICTGFEGGVGYWCCITGYVEPENPRSVMEDGEVFPHIDYPLTGGAVQCVSEVEDDSPTYTLDFEAVKRGLKLMSEKYPRHFSDFMSDDYDADTGDVFIQLCLLGELVYG